MDNFAPSAVSPFRDYPSCSATFPRELKVNDRSVWRVQSSGCLDLSWYSYEELVYVPWPCGQLRLLLGLITAQPCPSAQSSPTSFPSLPVILEMSQATSLHAKLLVSCFLGTQPVTSCLDPAPAFLSDVTSHESPCHWVGFSQTDLLWYLTVFSLAVPFVCEAFSPSPSRASLNGMNLEMVSLTTSTLSK